MYIAVGEIVVVKGLGKRLSQEEGWSFYECVEEGIKNY